MRQLVQLTRRADEFRELGAEIIVVFREDQRGVEGLRIIQERTETPYTLALDLDKEQTGRYSTGRMRFQSYVIGPDGTIVAIINGSLRQRANANQLIEAIQSIGAPGERNSAEETVSPK